METCNAKEVAICELLSRCHFAFDADLEQRICVFEEPSSDGVTGLVVGDSPLLLGLEDVRLLLQAGHHPLDGGLEVLVDDGVGELPGGDQGGLVGHVGDVGSGETGSEGGQLSAEVILVQVCLQPTQVDFEDR